MTEEKELPGATKMQKAWSFTLRWQEFIGWPLATVLVAAVLWVFGGGLDRTALKDIMPIWMVLPPKVAYAVCAAGLTFLVRRRWRWKLTADEQKSLWDSVCAGQPGAVLVYLTDAVFTVCVLLIFSLCFFSLPS
jgi:hypothetical protein